MLSSSSTEPPIDRAVITGTPGIGKSHAFFTLLPKLLMDGRVVGHERTYREHMTFYELDESHKQILAYPVYYSEARAALEKQLTTRDVIFRDFEDKKPDGIEPLGFQAREVLVSSPRRPGFSSLLKHVPSSAQLVLPAFSTEELEEFGRANSYDQATIDDALELQRWFGGVPRWCFEKARDPVAWLEFFSLVLKRQVKPIVDLCESPRGLLKSIAHYDDRTFPHRLLYLEPTAQHLLHRYAYPSRLVEELLLESQYVRRQVFGIRQLTHDFEQYGWQAFERLCIQTLLAKYPPVDYLPVKRARWDDRGRLKWEEGEEHFDLPHRSNRQENSTTTTMPDATTLLIGDRGQTTWDALSTEGVFNFTMAKRHNFALQGLKTAASLLGKASIKELPPFYWMVPQKDFDAGNFRIIVEGGNDAFVRQIEHRMIPRPEPSVEQMDMLIESVLADKLFADIDAMQCSTELKELVRDQLVSLLPPPQDNRNYVN